jgi:cytochrome c-type biogenesis protein
MDIESLRLALAEASLIGLAAGFAAGFIFSFNPVAFAAIPVTLAYVTKAHAPRHAMVLAGAFVAGMIVTHVALGVAAALGGEWVSGVMGRQWGLAIGPVLIVLGLLWPGWLRLKLPWFSLRGHPVAGVGGAFLLGVPFSIAVCPICSPALLVMLTAAAGVGSVPFGFALLLAFALGRALPILLGAWAVGWLESLKRLARWQKAFEIAGGMTLIVAGVYLIEQYIEMSM